MSKFELTPRPDYLRYPWTSTDITHKKEILNECARLTKAPTVNIENDINFERFRLLGYANKRHCDLRYSINEAGFITLKLYWLEMLAFKFGEFSMPSVSEATDYEVVTNRGKFSIESRGAIYWYQAKAWLYVDTTAFRRSVKAFNSERRQQTKLDLIAGQTSYLKTISEKLNGKI